MGDPTFLQGPSHKLLYEGIAGIIQVGMLM